MLSSTGEPHNLIEAVADQNWRQAMEEEYNALIENKTWHLVPPSSNKNLIDCKWVYSIKKKADGSIDSYKARLVAKGFKQRYGIDYRYVSNVSIIFGAPYLFYTICLMFRYTSWHFYAFSGTNLLTSRHSASSLFSAIFVFQKSYTGNILRIG
jgi:hypothetical protein